MKLRIPFGNYIDSQIKPPTAPYAHSLGMGNGMNVKRVGKQEALVPTHSNITNKLLKTGYLKRSQCCELAILRPFLAIFSQTAVRPFTKVNF